MSLNNPPLDEGEARERVIAWLISHELGKPVSPPLLSVATDLQLQRG